MAIIELSSDGHELFKCGEAFHSENFCLAQDLSPDPSCFGTDRSNLMTADKRPSIVQKLIHNILSGSPFTVGQYFGNSHSHKIIPSWHNKNSQHEDIEDSYPLIHVQVVQTRFGQLPLNYLINTYGVE